MEQDQLQRGAGEPAAVAAVVVVSARAVRPDRPQFVGPPVITLSATRKPPHLRDRSTTLTDAVVAAAGGRHVIVDGAGHYIHHDRPDVVIAEIRSLNDAAAGTAKAHRARTIHSVPCPKLR